jgi:hypothetical protein
VSEQIFNTLVRFLTQRAITKKVSPRSASSLVTVTNTLTVASSDVTVLMKEGENIGLSLSGPVLNIPALHAQQHATPS